MPIYLHETKGYRCWRVAVSIGGKVTQEYFRLENRASAERREKELKKLAAQARLRRLEEALPSERARWPARTGVKGIRLVCEVKVRPLGSVFYCPFFEVTAGLGARDEFARDKVYVTELGIKEAWEKALRTRDRMLGINSWKGLVDRCPDEEQVDAVVATARKRLYT